MHAVAYNINISKPEWRYVALQPLTAAWLNIEPWTHPATAADGCLVISGSAVATSLDNEWVEWNTSWICNHAAGMSRTFMCEKVRRRWRNRAGTYLTTGVWRLWRRQYSLTPWEKNEAAESQSLHTFTKQAPAWLQGKCFNREKRCPGAIASDRQVL